MTALTLLGILLATPVPCPPEVGNIRWDGVTYMFNSGGKKFDAAGSLWDRDRNGAPSKGDLLRVDSATAGGNAMSIDEVWVTIGPSLAKDLARRFKKIGPRLEAQCETRFELEGVPQIASSNALGKHLRASDSGTIVMSRTEKVEQAMLGWVDQRCKPGVHTDEKTLRKWLYEQSARKYGDVGKKRLKSIAASVAKKNSMKCAHLNVPKLTFD